ncbi:hypothetical protein K9L63_03260 [Candidatus Gracilibacteria bacterium]|nr:hypothetical protein [Candidatus Gracilibacteria bacterium]
MKKISFFILIFLFTGCKNSITDKNEPNKTTQEFEGFIKKFENIKEEFDKAKEQDFKIDKG